MSILISKEPLGFITSDAPCVWFNPKAHTFPPFYRSPGLAQTDIEVTLPLTPHHLLYFSHVAVPLYIDIKDAEAEILNHRTLGFCDQEFVSWKGGANPRWFEKVPMPADAWENTEEGKEAHREQEELDALNAKLVDPPISS
jgi:hypothetical protein